MNRISDFGADEMERACSLIREGLLEDDVTQDITTMTLIDHEVGIRAEFVSRHSGVLCGLPILAELFRQLEPAISLRPTKTDGDTMLAGERFLEITGPARPILRGERLALNFLQHLSGIATTTRQFVDAIAGSACQILDTRKTTPGWRILEKYAVRMGGGQNHRKNLSEFALIKDNHRRILQWSEEVDMTSWVEKFSGKIPEILVELEVDNLEEFQEALRAEPEIILLDNFTLEDLKQAITLVDKWPGKRPLLEASGGISIQNVRAISETGVDRISLGAITHSAVAVDIGLDVVEMMK